jgi:hypothetical protein
MKRIIREFASKPQHGQCDACFVVIMTHGTSDKGNDYVYSYDNLQIETEWILTQFNNENSQVLREKPKVFIFQSCRGDVPDAGVRTEPVAYTFGQSLSSGTLETDGGASVARRRTLATFTDMLIAHSTVPGQYTSRDLPRCPNNTNSCNAGCAMAFKRLKLSERSKRETLLTVFLSFFFVT